MNLALYGRDDTLARVGEVDDWTDLTMPLRYNDTSTWALTLAGGTRSAATMTGATGLVVVRDGVTVLSGPITRRQVTLSKGRQQVVLSGIDDTGMLADRLALPSAPPYTLAAYDVRSGPADTVLAEYVDANAGPSAGSRAITGLTVPTPAGTAAAVTGTARFQTVLELLQRLALDAGGLGFRVVQEGTGLVFQTYASTDRTRQAVFSVPLGNLAEYDLAITRPSATYAVVAGQGEGVARQFVEGGTGVLPRVETFVDARDTDDPAVLAQRLDGALVEGQPRTSLSISPVETDSVQFGRDYMLGDVVTVVVDGVPVQDVVRQVSLSYNGKNGETLTPIIGTPGATNPAVPVLFDRMRGQAVRLSTLERQ